MISRSCDMHSFLFVWMESKKCDLTKFTKYCFSFGFSFKLTLNFKITYCQNNLIWLGLQRHISFLPPIPLECFGTQKHLAPKKNLKQMVSLKLLFNSDHFNMTNCEVISRWPTSILSLGDLGLRIKSLTIWIPTRPNPIVDTHLIKFPATGWKAAELLDRLFTTESQSHRVTELQSHATSTPYTGGWNFFMHIFNKLPYSLRSQGD